MTAVPAKLPDPNGTVLVVFSGETDIRWLRILKSGYRHCFACLFENGQWIIYDPLAHMTDLSVRNGLDSVDLEYWFRRQGYRTIRTFRRTTEQKKLPPAIFTCVEAVKRLCGIQDITILTPWQLYRHLKNY